MLKFNPTERLLSPDDTLAHEEMLSDQARMSRRSALGLLGMAGLGMLFAGKAEAASVYLNGKLISGGGASAASGAAAASTMAGGTLGGVSGTGTVGRVTNGASVVLSDAARSLPGCARYVDFLTKLNLKRIDVAKVIESHVKERSGVHNTLPPMMLWRNLAPTLRVADEIAKRLGEDVHQVISAYRCPSYNRQCRGGASHSQHLRNVAMDLVFSSSPSRVAKVASEVRGQGLFAGGIGRYPGFTHVDTRGVNADW